MHEVSTIILSGGAAERTPAIAREFRGGALRISDVFIADHVSYAQQAPRHLLNVPLAVDGAPSSGIALSFTPADRERRGRTCQGGMIGLQIGFDDWFFDEACEQPVRASLKAADKVDAKSTLMAHAIVSLDPRQTPDRIAHDTMLIALARHLGRTYGHTTGRRDDGWLHPRALSRVIERIGSDPAMCVSLQDLAAEAGLGVSAFIRAFRGSVGVTPAAFARRMRLERAAQLLQRTDLPVGEIALLCGFSSAWHFIGVFSAGRGTTPARWRSTLGPAG
ncbi:helix-turn-helix domain-containing protein [Sphingomonas sp. M1-B02]|uniref:helix-turn-helix domain-containing protein n=1 Tax=Sphingomonas sp. M1-B02 TaxID=3114300 RepID=UPI00223FDF40|nr:AraC family transcriptional regulator [Sphingomonas sp. S6-11]UZK66658.1 AraC family transcriptional regulator [Sphingomonas sp. S6-11]